MKRKLYLISITFLAVIAMFSVMMFKNVSHAATETIDGLTWYYQTSGSNATNVRLYSAPFDVDISTLTIPSQLAGRNVISVGGGSSYNNALAGFESRVKTVNIPDTVTRVQNYAFYNCSALENVNFGNSVTYIGNYAFYGTSLTEVVFPDTVTSVGNSAFYNIQGDGIRSVTLGDGFTSDTQLRFLSDMYYLAEYKTTPACTSYKAIDGILYNGDVTEILRYPDNLVTENYVMPETVKKVRDNVFSYKNLRGTITFSPVLEEIGNYSFSGTGITGDLNLPSTVKTIGYNAFEWCRYITGDVALPNIESLGSSAFYGCSNLNGTLTIGDNLTTIEYSTFYETHFSKVVIGSGIEEIGGWAFEGYNDIWIRREPGTTVVAGISESTDPYIHWLNDTHKLRIVKPAGIKVINAVTGEEITNGFYPCESEFTYKVVLEDGYSYSNLKLVEVNAGDKNNFVSYDFDPDATYNFTNFIRERDIYIQSISEGSDLALRTYITEVNREKVSRNRDPRLVFDSGKPEYMHTKYPVVVKTGDLVTFNVRVYNEGLQKASASKVSIYLPEGLELDLSNKMNDVWTSEGNGKYSSTKLADKLLDSNIGNGALSTGDIPFIARVTAEKSEEEDIIKSVFAEIETATGEDIDSEHGNIDIENPSNFDLDEIYASDASSIIKGQEDDDDFEVIVLKGKIRVDYAIKVDKIDENNNALLKGATFNLVDLEGNVKSTATTGDDGSLVFDVITTYGDGEDIWFIEETKAPAGYENSELKKIKVRVEKTIINEERGTYSVRVFCDTADYSINYERYDFTPIKTADQLKKMGSGDVVTVDGVDYEYNIDTFYRLENDIDLDGEEWTPIVPEMECILDGNGHKISNLTITSDEDLSRAEVGLFSSFTGMIENLELENVNIDINGFTANAETRSGKTGVGAFAGVMKTGMIKNCKITGNSKVTAKTDNVGGFVGHTTEGGYVVIEDCINNANVSGKPWVETVIEEGETVTKNSGSSNVGGFVGCALGSFTVKNSVNNGAVHGEKYNAGGFVGFANSDDYLETGIIGGFDETNKVIELVVENDKGTYGTYNLGIEIIDEKTHEYLPDAVYTVYGGDKNIIEGLDHILIENGRLNLLTEDAKTTGYDRYYLIENTPVADYPETEGVIRLVVERYWDDESRTYKVRATCTVITEEQFNEETAQPEEEKETPGPSYTGDIFDESEIFTEAEIEKANWNYRKEEFIDCTNNGEVTITSMNAAGILGTTYGTTTMTNCTNNGAVTAKQNAGGFVAELRTKDINPIYPDSEDELGTIETQNTEDYSEFKGCTNNGKISSYAPQEGTEWQSFIGSAGGFISLEFGNVKLSEVVNKGEVYALGSQCAGGLVGDVEGILEIDKCDNEGKIKTESIYDWSDTDCLAGGLVAKNYAAKLHRDENLIRVTNSNNYGEIYASNHMGGIVGLATGDEVTISNCKVNNSMCEEDSITGEKELLKIHTIQSGDKGGIIGKASATYTTVSNCEVENVDIRHEGTETSSYGSTGGIVGLSYGNVDPHNTDTITVLNCTVKDSDIEGYAKEAAGILGAQFGSSYKRVNTNIIDCKILDCNISTNMPDGSGSTYAAAAGLYGAAYETGILTIDNCLVEGGKIWQNNHNESYASGNAAGFVACSCYADEINISNSDVVNVDILNSVVLLEESSSCTAGGIAHTLSSSWGSAPTEIRMNNCNFDNLNLSGPSGCVGGAIGFTNNGNVDIDEVNVNECNMELKASCSNNNIGGIFACPQGNERLTITNSKVIGKSTNVENEKTTFEAPRANIGGLLGHINYSKTLIDNIEVKNIVMKYRDTKDEYAYDVGGLMGSNGGDVIMKNCLVENCDASANTAYNVAGAIGCNYDDIIFENVTIKDSSFSNDRVDYSNSTVAGFVGSFTNNDTTMTNCHVINCDVAGKCITSGGAVGYASGLTVKDCSVEDTTVTNDWVYDSEVDTGSYHDSMAMGGFAGSITSSAYLDGITVKNTSCTSNYGSVGGIYGYVNQLEQLDSITAEGLTLKCTNSKSYRNGAVAGIGANTYNAPNGIKNITAKNSTIETASHLVGGLFGYIERQVTMTNCTANNQTILHKNIKFEGYTDDQEVSPYITDGIAGGIVAMANEMNMSGCTVNGGSITVNSSATEPNESSKVVHTGGVQGFINNHTSMTDCTTNGLTIVNNTMGITGGIVGLNQKGLDIYGNNINAELSSTRSKVTGNASITGMGHVGGILGLGKITSSNDKVENSTITVSGYQYSYYNAGGIIGIGESNSDINNASVKNVSITGPAHVGGIAGVYYGAIRNAEVTNSTLSVTNESSGCAGGIAGIQSSGSTEYSTVDKCEITSLTNHAGGAIGCTTNLVSDVTVKNTKVTAANLAGGVIGAGSGYGVMPVRLTVSGNTIVGDTTIMDGDGLYIGAPNIYVPATNSSNPSSTNSVAPLNSVSPLSTTDELNVDNNIQNNSLDENNDESNTNIQTNEENTLENGEAENNNNTNNEVINDSMENTNENNG